MPTSCGCVVGPKLILLPKLNPWSRGGGVFGTRAVEIVLGWFAGASAAPVGRFADVNAGGKRDIKSPQEF